jgi:hypothetical protein
MEPDRRRAVMVAMVVGHSGPHHCSAELSGRIGSDAQTFLRSVDPGRDRCLNDDGVRVGPGGAWCVSGHSQVGSNSYLGRAER